MDKKEEAPKAAPAKKEDPKKDPPKGDDKGGKGDEEAPKGRDKNEPLSTRKQDFQMRLKVMEARQLPGSNVSPTCRITCYDQKKHTKVIECCSSPFWNEMFFFNFNDSPSELFDQVLLFEIYDSKKMRSDSFIGSFKIEIGMIYDEPLHSFINKWLLLCDPEQMSDGHKGYLKISVALLGPGDDPPSFGLAKFDTADDDIEANLLRPAGLVLRPATYKLKLYMAEDLPRMDSNLMDGVKMVFGAGERKELVDPFFKLGFAGREVISNVIYTCFSPTWNTELRLGLWFPSMCEKIKLQMFDWDRLGDDDCIGTHYLLTSQISQIGNEAVSNDGVFGKKKPQEEEAGYLPMFGPCFVNFYGSPREYSDLASEFEDLNLGKGLGVAYRGRVLVELHTLMGELPATPMEDITNDDLVRAQKFMRRRKFKLHSAFLDASMIGIYDSPVEFEVSIGNYGNRLDEYLAPCVCSTQPTNPVFDGTYYYYLPWADTKPCVVIDCHWEDVIFRLEALNLLIYISDSLESQLDNIRLAQKGNIDITELASSVIALLDDVIVKCQIPLPEPNKNQLSNMLDRKLMDYRRAVLKHLVDDGKRLREEATDIDESLRDIEELTKEVKQLQIEPQNSIPDVMVWMLTGEKRVAYFRCASNLIIWSANPQYRGKYCGKLSTFILKYPGSKAEKENKWEIPALIRGRLWLGLEKNENKWHQMKKEGELTVFAETYENQVSVLGKWTARGPTMSRPKWSDVSGKVELNKDQFRTPGGWVWDGEWYINPDVSMLFEKDANRTDYIEDVYEYQSRTAGGTWKPATVAWADMRGDACAGIKDIELPVNWQWVGDWQVDLNRAVDENAYEYANDVTIGGYGPVEKMFHLCRRRRWLRARKVVKTKSVEEEQEKNKKLIAEGWEYAPLFTMKFRLRERKMDLVRRRRWHRKMIPQGTSKSESAIFQFSTNLPEEEVEEVTEKTYESEIAKSVTSAPRMFMYTKQCHKYQLRAYIYQARNLLAADTNGLSDPFARVAFLSQSQFTDKILKTLCPTWDQSLVFEGINIWGDPKNVFENPPDIVIEFFDHDTFGSAQFLGRSFCKPVVKLDPNDNRQPVLLKWYDVKKGEKDAGELLAAFELFLADSGKDLPFPPPKTGKNMMVPNGIRPQMVRTAVEVMCWGIRNMKKYQLLEVSSPNVEIEINGAIQESKIIKDMAKNPNFDDPILFFDVMLPKEELYAPPINIKVKDNRAFGRRPLVGIHSITTLEPFRCDPLESDDDEDDDRAVQLMGNAGASAEKENGDEAVTIEENLEDDIDWWSKFYASLGEVDKCSKYLEHGYDKIQVYATELEKVKIHSEFSDFCATFKLSRGKADDDEDSLVAGEFKGTFYVYPLPADTQATPPPRIIKNLPSSGPIECIVRVYCIRAYDLQSSDPNGLADPYILIKVGKTEVDNKKEYKPNTLEPTFGTMFEVKTILPREKDLRVIVKDYDLIGSDDTIGETIIDLENRFLTKMRATVGLPQTYCPTGICKWRDSKLPSELLEDFCSSRMKGLVPLYANDGNVASIGRKTFVLSDFEQRPITHGNLGEAKERLALYILNTYPMDVLGYPLVLEHVETRALYNSLQPGIEQGKIQMWIDLFPVPMGPPGSSVDISSRLPKDYELRIVLWNTKDVILDEVSITGEAMSDIYVKAWLGNPNEKQETDVHYRSMDGDGNFNWRFVFPFKFIPAEECMVIKEKEHFWSLDETEKRMPPMLTLQIWDNDMFSKDDFLGSVELNLNSMPDMAKTSDKCTLDQLPQFNKTGKKVKMVSLLEKKKMNGFWACYSNDKELLAEGETAKLAGKIEMEMSLITGPELEDKQVGRARDEPNQHPVLEPPKRPETSFFWFTSPWKTFKHIVWKRFKKYFITLLVVFLLGLFIFLFFYNLPGAVARKMIGA